MQTPSHLVLPVDSLELTQLHRILPRDQGTGAQVPEGQDTLGSEIVRDSAREVTSEVVRE